MRRRLGACAFLAAAVALAACTAGASPTPVPLPTGSPAPTIGPLPTPADRDLSLAELRYRLLDAFAPVHYCDPDEYPVPLDDEGEKAIATFAQIQADTETFAAILARLGLTGTADFTADQKLAIYRQSKHLNAVVLAPAGGDRFAFDLVTATNEGLGEGIRTAGTIDRRGTIDITSRETGFLTSCPICLARGTLIETPRGPVAVDALRAGDPVWTLDASGRRIEGTLLSIASARVPAGHRVVHLVLDDGRQLRASPGHPLPDGRRLGDLRSGDAIDGARVRLADLVGYGEALTFDLLPSGPTGAYWANGVLLGSTLAR